MHPKEGRCWRIKGEEAAGWGFCSPRVMKKVCVKFINVHDRELGVGNAVRAFRPQLANL